MKFSKNQKIRKYESIISSLNRNIEILEIAFAADQPRVPAGNSTGGQWISSGVGGVNSGRSGDGRRQMEFAARRVSVAREAQCEAQRARDEFQCRLVRLRACYGQAMLRFGNCLAGKPIPPLNY